MRIPPAEPRSLDPEDPLAALYNGIRQLRGDVPVLYKVLGNQPSALMAFLAMSKYVRDQSALAPRLRELTILRTAQVLDVPYEVWHHDRAARLAGVGDADLRNLARWREWVAFSPSERAALNYAEAVSRMRKVSDDTFADLRVHFSLGEIIDLSLVVAWYHFCAALLEPLQIELEPAVAD